MPRQAQTLSNSRVEMATHSTLAFFNRQRTRKLDVALLRQITVSALADLPRVSQWDLTFYFVGAKRMAEVNETHLHHQGPTDVITFDYNDTSAPGRLTGEIFICPDIAILQAREFHTTWQSEVVRYLVHALLHLCGYDDLKPGARRTLKVVENRLVRKLGRQFNLAALGVVQKVVVAHAD